jgi:hypothetical protein
LNSKPKTLATKNPRAFFRPCEMSEHRIAYASRVDATPRGEIGALAAVYRFVIDRANRSAAGVPSTNGDDAMKGSKNDHASTIIQESN